MFKPTVSFEVGSRSVMVGSKKFLVKLVLFHLDGFGHPQDGALPSFFHGLRGSIYGLSY